MDNQQKKQASIPYIDGLDYRTNHPIRVYFAGESIERIEPLTHSTPGQRLPWIAPGLVDLQINGCFGIDFNTLPLTVEAVHEATRQLWASGVTTYYPTVITNSDEAIASLLEIIAEARRSDPLTAASIAGIHLEGPFITPEDGPRGAHSRIYVRAPEWASFERWQQAADGLIRIITLSPEWEEAPDFITKCVQAGVTVSIGHTSATPDQIAQAVRAGATFSTHLGNGAHLTLPRHPNYIWEQLASDELSAGVIADGFHLPRSVLQVFLKAKGRQLFLVSDAVYLSGLAPGEYETHIGGRVVLTDEGRLHVKEHPGLLAGSAQLLKAGIVNLVQAGLTTRADAWQRASIYPAAFMGLAEGRGLAAGAPADLVTLGWEDAGELIIQDVYKRGHHVITSNVTSSSSQA